MRSHMKALIRKLERTTVYAACFKNVVLWYTLFHISANKHEDAQKDTHEDIVRAYKKECSNNFDITP